MNVHDLECFLAVADELHFGRAAKRLHIAQPSVSQAVRRLERDIGGPLFDRTKRSVVLTELGKVFYERGKGAHQSLEQAWREARKLARPDSTVSVSVVPDARALTLRAVQLALETRPDLVVDLPDWTTGEALVESLRRRELDAIVTMPAPLDDAFSSVVLGGTFFSAVLHPGCSIARQQTVTFADLISEQLVVGPVNTNPDMQRLVLTTLEQAGYQGALITASSMEGAVAYVMAGKGIAISLDSMRKSRPFAGLIHLPISDSPPVELAACWHRDSSSPAVQALIAALVQISAEDAAQPVALDPLDRHAHS
ncbi:MAG: LysR family transcriptional regulator [Acidobacteria bacterium]|nr:LysR family transcriptional regulator [Acidobacteriota bacterium]